MNNISGKKDDNKVSVSKSFKIDKTSRIPYYLQLKQYIIKEIEAERWKPGEQMIPEIKVCDLFDISRTVVRQTFQELVNEGYFIKKKAKGTYITIPKIEEDLVQRLTGFYEDMTSRGYKVTNDIISQKVTPASSIVSEKLSIEKGEKVIAINRLRRLNGEPIVLDTTHIPYEICPDLLDEDLTNKSLYTFLEREHKIEIEEGIRTIEVTIAKKEEAKLLNIKQGDPLFFIQSVSYLKDGRALEYYHAYHRGDRSSFIVKLKRSSSSRGNHTDSSNYEIKNTNKK